MTLLSLAAALTLMAPAVQDSPSGQAAATLPNTFDRPAATATPPAPLPSVQAPDVARSETALRQVIAELQGGEIDYAAYTDTVAAALREQQAAVQPLIAGFGALRTVEFVGQENGADLFLIRFDNALTQWIIGFDADDRIAALLFRPAPEE